ncbi:MAG: hypothetical protein OIF36_02305 [Alphaproteobacteria bacterium]|nr:hypothetical protein [Alphaproteobacteria bacterium]
MAYQKFTQVGGSFSPRCSVNTNGNIGLNQGSRKKYLIDNYSYVVLYYDRECKKIGIEMLNDKTAEGAIKIRKGAYGANIAAKSFFNCFNIMPEKTSYFDTRIDERGWIEIDLESKKVRNSKVVSNLNS